MHDRCISVLAIVSNYSVDSAEDRVDTKYLNSLADCEDSSSEGQIDPIFGNR